MDAEWQEREQERRIRQRADDFPRRYRESLHTEIEALRASVARLTAERDAARSAIRAALDGADIAADGDGAWLDQSIVDRLRLGLECRPEAGELPDDGE
jgi:hypothetical protein